MSRFMAPSQAIQAHLHRIGQALLYRMIQALLYRKIQALQCRVIQALLNRKIQELEQALLYRFNARFSKPRIHCKTEVSYKVTEDCYRWSESVAKPSLLSCVMVCNIFDFKAKRIQNQATSSLAHYLISSKNEQI